MNAIRIERVVGGVVDCIGEKSEKNGKKKIIFSSFLYNKKKGTFWKKEVKEYDSGREASLHKLHE